MGERLVRSGGSGGRSGLDIFGLGLAQLQSILDNIAGDRVISCAAAAGRELQGHRGYSAEKMIATLSWVTESGRAGETPVFVKWFHRGGPHEARHYEWLSACGAPIARMYGSLLTPDNREMLFLECLSHVDAMVPFDEFLLDSGQFLPFVSAAARFNAVRPPAEYVSSLPVWNCAEVLAGGHSVLDSLWARASGGHLGRRLADLCAGHAGEVNCVHDAIEKVMGPIGGMETGLCHNDFWPDSTCRHPAKGESVVIDLESVGIAPRFRDIARWLGAAMEGQRSCISPRDAAEFYLREYDRAGGPSLPVSQLLAEAPLLHFAGLVEMLWFSLARAMDGRVDWTNNVEEGREVFREQLLRTTRTLLAYARRFVREI